MLTNEEYHAHPAVSRSKLASLERSPWHYWMAHINPERPLFKPTPSMEEGTAIHRAVLEPELFDKTYMVAPDINRNSNKWKEFVLENEGKILLKEAEMGDILNSKNAILSHPLAKEILRGAECEQSFFWKDPQTGLECKCRPDILNRRLKIVGDIKKAANNSKSEFEKDAAKYAYFREAAWYIDGLKQAENLEIDAFVFITVENKYPYSVELYTYEADDLQYAREESSRLLTLLNGSLQSNSWPKNDQEIKQIKIPQWRKS